MPLFNAAEEADLETELGDLLTDSCLIKRPNRTQDGSGGWTSAYNTVGVALPCRYGASGFAGVNTEQALGEQVLAIIPGMITLPKYTNVLTTDRIHVTIVETGEVVVVEVSKVGKSSDENWREITGQVLRA